MGDTSTETRTRTHLKRSRVCQTSSEDTAETSPDGENAEEIVKTVKKRIKRIQETGGSVNRSLDAVYKEMLRLKDETRGYREEVNKVRTELQSELQSMVQTKMKGKFILPRH